MLQVRRPSDHGLNLEFQAICPRLESHGSPPMAGIDHKVVELDLGPGSRSVCRWEPAPGSQLGDELEWARRSGLLQKRLRLTVVKDEVQPAAPF